MEENQPQAKPPQMPPYPPSYYRTPRKSSNWWIPLTIIGVFLILVVVIIVVFFSFVASSIESQPVEVKKNSVLYLNFAKGLKEYNKENPFAAFTGGGTPATFLSTLTAIKNAKTDDNIKGIYYRSSFRNTGFAKTAELIDAITDFKSSGKFVYSYIEVGNERSYLNALPSDKIFMPEEGYLGLNGFGITGMFFKNMLNDIGVDFYVQQYEDFKSAAEAFIRTKFSDSARVQLYSLIDQRYDYLLDEIAENRPMDRKSANEMISRGIYTADSLLDLKFIDELATESQVINKMKFIVFGDTINPDDEKLELISPGSYNSGYKGGDDKKADKDKQIAIIYGVGTIGSGKGSDSPFDDEMRIHSGSFVKYLKKAREDDDVKAIILRIDSPGGSVIASDEIWSEIMKTKKVKPIYASMSDVAASGGYYMAMACDTIIARPETITGSIGVILAIPNISRLLGKIDVTTDTLSTTPSAQFLNGAYPFTDRDKAKLHSISEKIYKRFVSKVAESRGKTFDEARAVAKGRIWTGKDAMDRGLIDVLGGFKTALDIAKRSMGVDPEQKVYVKVFPEHKEGIEALLDMFGMGDKDNDDASSGTNLAKMLGMNANQLLASWDGLPENFKVQFKYILELIELSKNEQVMMAMPYKINVN